MQQTFTTSTNQLEKTIEAALLLHANECEFSEIRSGII